MNLSVAWMRSARCTIDHWRFSGIQVNLRLQSVNEGCREKVETIMATCWKASLSRQLFP